MVDASCTGQGIGYQLGQHSIETCRQAGDRAMQFNSVVSTNHVAIRLWERLGFRQIGAVPKAFERDDIGFVDLLIWYRELESGGGDEVDKVFAVLVGLPVRLLDTVTRTEKEHYPLLALPHH